MKTNNEVVNDLIDKVANLTINYEVGNDIIDKVANMKISEVGNNLYGANTSDVQVQFTGNIAGISHKNLLSSRKIGSRHKEVPVLDCPTELSFGEKESTGFDNQYCGLTGATGAQDA